MEKGGRYKNPNKVAKTPGYRKGCWEKVTRRRRLGGRHRRKCGWVGEVASHRVGQVVG